MTTATELIDSFFASHSITDSDERRARLTRSLDPAAEFHSLQVTLIGIDEITEGFVGEARLVRTSPVEMRGSWLRWEWAYHDLDGQTLTAADGTGYAGVAIGRMSGDRLALVVPYLGNRPPLE